jgi:molybdopterin converting factor small subunit
LETLTAHPQSVKDDFLNTRYFSHYDQKYGKPEVRNEAEEAIKTIEGHLMRLRGEFEHMSMERGVDLGDIEERIMRQRYELERKAQEEFEKLINDKNRLD